MNALVLILMLASCGRPAPVAAPHAADDVNPIRALEPGLYAMDFAGSSAKSTIVELDHAVVLIDVPIRDAGGGAPLLDDVAGGERVLRSLARRFPSKPLRYVLSSHAHPHSLSAWRAFVEHGVVLVTTRSNYARLQTMLDDRTRGRAARQVQLVDDAPVTLGDRTNPIIAHRFRKADYPSVPTEDYLYFELPRYGAVYTACMFDRWAGPPVAGRELLTRREEDLFKLLTTERVGPQRLIRLDREPASELLPFAVLAHAVATGVRADELARRYRDLTVAALRADRARLVDDAVRDGLPPQILNSLVYDSLEHRRLDRAFELAVLQALLAPASANVWDTLAEVCFFRGEVALARASGEHANRLDPKLESGEARWAQNLARQTAAWTTAGIVEARAD